MKPIVALALVLSLASPALAEQPLLGGEQNLRASGTRMRAAGVSLTLTGIASLVFGVAMMAAEANHNATCGYPHGGPCGDAKGLLMAPGGGLVAASSALLGTGIPLWAVGQQRIRRSASFAIAPSVGRTGVDGASASFKLTF